MKTSLSLIIIFSISLLISCQALYEQYIPAPHEMAARNSLSLTPPHPVPEELISVQSTQSINLEILRSLMKTRGYQYIGYRVFKSEYQPSANALKKAAYSINSSFVLYFIATKEIVREKKNKNDFSGLIGGLVQAKKSEDYKRVLNQSLKQEEKWEDITYYTYLITYWNKATEEAAVMLDENEIAGLKAEQEKTRKEIKYMRKRISHLEKQKRYEKTLPVKEERVQIKEEIVQIKKEIVQKESYKDEIDKAIDRDETRKIHFRDV